MMERFFITVVILILLTIVGILFLTSHVLYKQIRAYKKESEEKQKHIKHLENYSVDVFNSYIWYKKSFEELNNSKLSLDEINDIIFLCHPDKHNCSDRSNRITTKFIQLKEELKSNG